MRHVTPKHCSRHCRATPQKEDRSQDKQNSLVAVRVEVRSTAVALAAVKLPFVSRVRGVVVYAFPVGLAVAPLTHVAVTRRVPRGSLS